MRAILAVKNIFNAPYHFVDTEQEFKTLVIGLRP